MLEIWMGTTDRSVWENLLRVLRSSAVSAALAVSWTGCGAGWTGRADNDPDSREPTEENRLEGAALASSIRRDADRRRIGDGGAAETPAAGRPIAEGDGAGGVQAHRCPSDRDRLRRVLLYAPPTGYAAQDETEEAFYCPREGVYWYRVTGGGGKGVGRVYGPFPLNPTR